jgi:hypothetical protein
MQPRSRSSASLDDDDSPSAATQLPPPLGGAAPGDCAGGGISAAALPQPAAACSGGAALADGGSDAKPAAAAAAAAAGPSGGSGAPAAPAADAAGYATYAEWRGSQRVSGTHSFSLYTTTNDAAAAAGGGDAPAAAAARVALVALGAELGCGRYCATYAAWHPLDAAEAPDAADSAAARGRPAPHEPLAVRVFAESTSAAALAAAEVVRLCALRHPNLLPVYGFVASPPKLLVARGVRGTLADALRAAARAAGPSAQPPLTWRARVALAAGVAAGAAFLHEQAPPIAHGDIKPENVHLAADGTTPLLADVFVTRGRRGGSGAAAAGGAAAAEERNGDGDESGAAEPLVGTPLYLAPEAASGALPLAMPLAADVYSFGAAVLHALAHAGAAAASGGTAADVADGATRCRFASPLWRHLAEACAFDAARAAAEWAPLQVQFARAQADWQPELTPSCPPPLARLIRAACAAAPEQRPAMAALRDELLTLEASAERW